LKKNISNKNISFSETILFFPIAILILSSCNPTKYVPKDETLLDETHIIINNAGLKKENLWPYVKQKPNKRIFGTKFHLGLYNLSNINKDKWPHKWLREIGEEPVIFDPYSTEKSKEQLQSYVASKGYFDSHVLETIETENQKTKVFYNVDLKEPYTIRNLYYEIADTNIRKYFYFDSVNCLIERGRPYDVDILTAERNRFVHYIKDQGFYSFSGDNLTFEVDSTLGKRQVDIYYNIKEFSKPDANNIIRKGPHSIYTVKNIYIYPDFIPKDALAGGENYLKSLDTVYYKGYYFISPSKKPGIKYDLIIQSLYLKQGANYNVTNTEQTQTHLLALKTYRLVNIFYTDVSEPGVSFGLVLSLDCTVQLTLLSKQSFKVELEGTNTAGSLGGAVNLIYQNKNLLHGAELFNLKLKGAYEAISQKDTLSGSQEYGIETSLRFPKFIIPFLQTEGFIKKYNPATTILAAYDYQNMPFYNRTIANATFGYTWNGSSYNTHIVNPVQLNLVKLLRIEPDFKARIDSSSYLAYSYRDGMILGGSYSFIFNNQKIKNKRNYWFIRINAETAGNLPSLVCTLAGATKKDESYYILNQPFAQYIRADIDMRYTTKINDLSSIVYRGFVGAGIPYGNSRAIPFEKQYFGGGANGIRAWQVRTLGPGSYVPFYKGFLNQTADIKIEANAEYRFKLFWILEGALFLDAGNIWSYNYDAARPGSQFKINSFYKDIAVGTGTGFRFDFSFVLMRADLGMKLRDPWITYGSKWIIMNRPYSFKNDFAIIVAIGYPF
jgi:outer membrane protein assembly factor BamA